MKKHVHIIDALFILALFLVFCVCSILVVIVGARGYTQIASQMDRNFSINTAYSYITQKFHENDHHQGISLTQVEGIQVLVLSQEMAGQEIETMVYVQDGYLQERTSRAGSPPTLLGGQPIVPLETLTFHPVSSNLWAVEITLAEQPPHRFYLSLHSEGGGNLA